MMRIWERTFSLRWAVFMAENYEHAQSKAGTAIVVLFNAIGVTPVNGTQ